MLEIGVRVVRGPDWKWGNQVMCHSSLFFQSLFKSSFEERK